MGYGNKHEEYYLPYILFQNVGGLTKEDIRAINSKYSSTRKSESGIPVFGMINALNTERKRLLSAAGVSDSDDIKLDFEMKHENIQKTRIINQTKLGRLILKEEASSRVKSAFKSVAASMKHHIKTVSPELVNQDEVRDIEKILTDSYNQIVLNLEKQAEILSWEEDGSAKLLQTRLAKLEQMDKEVEDAEAQSGGSELPETSREEISTGSSEDSETSFEE